MKAGRGVEKAYATLRLLAARLTQDRPLAEDIEQTAEAIRAGRFEV
jgi:histidine ammonia-lyase